MKVVVCPSDNTGCGRYRMIWPAEAVKSLGVNVSIERRPRILANQKTTPPTIYDALIDADVVVFQRPGSYQITQIIPILQKKGIKVVIDMDDDLSCIHPRNPSFNFYNPKTSPYRNWEWAEKACLLADLVTVTTEALADRYGPHGRVKILPNCVPESYLNVKHGTQEMVTIGWPGWVLTHPEDLQITHGSINQAMSKQNARFMAIGDVRIFEKLGIRNRYPHVFHDAVEMDQYPETVAQLDIGIVPLADTPFNRSKSWLKALEFAALGVAPVVSSTPDNMRLVDEGGAYVARSPKEWKDIVLGLITDEVSRKELVEQSRQIASHWTIEKNAPHWAQAWC